MPSPFPGMDPYLERQWRDVHGSLVIYARDALNEQLGGELVARCDERLVIGQSDAPPPAASTRTFAWSSTALAACPFGRSAGLPLPNRW